MNIPLAHSRDQRITSLKTEIGVKMISSIGSLIVLKLWLFGNEKFHLKESFGGNSNNVTTEQDAARAEINRSFAFDCKSCLLLAMINPGIRNILLPSLLLLSVLSVLFCYIGSLSTQDLLYPH